MAEEKSFDETQDRKVAKIVIDRELCIGAASCVAIAPGVFALDKENKAYVVDPERNKKPSASADSKNRISYGVDENGADNEIILNAARSCPTKAITLYDKDGNQIL